MQLDEDKQTEGDRDELVEAVSEDDQGLVNAVNMGDVQEAEERINKGARLNLTSKNWSTSGRSLLHQAVEKGDVQMVQLLRSKGAADDIEDEDEDTPRDLVDGIQDMVARAAIISALDEQPVFGAGATLDDFCRRAGEHTEGISAYLAQCREEAQVALAEDDGTLLATMNERPWWPIVYQVRISTPSQLLEAVKEHIEDNVASKHRGNASTELVVLPLLQDVAHQLNNLQLHEWWFRARINKDILEGAQMVCVCLDKDRAVSADLVKLMESSGALFDRMLDSEPGKRPLLMALCVGCRFGDEQGNFFPGKGWEEITVNEICRAAEDYCTSTNQVWKEKEHFFKSCILALGLDFGKQAYSYESRATHFLGMLAAHKMLRQQQQLQLVQAKTAMFLGDIAAYERDAIDTVVPCRALEISEFLETQLPPQENTAVLANSILEAVANTDAVRAACQRTLCRLVGTSNCPPTTAATLSDVHQKFMDLDAEYHFKTSWSLNNKNGLRRFENTVKSSFGALVKEAQNECWSEIGKTRDGQRSLLAQMDEYCKSASAVALTKVCSAPAGAAQAVSLQNRIENRVRQQLRLIETPQGGMKFEHPKAISASFLSLKKPMGYRVVEKFKTEFEANWKGKGVFKAGRGVAERRQRHIADKARSYITEGLVLKDHFDQLRLERELITPSADEFKRAVANAVGQMTEETAQSFLSIGKSEDLGLLKRRFEDLSSMILNFDEIKQLAFKEGSEIREILLIHTENKQSR